MRGSLYIVDALNYLFRAFHALPPLRNGKGQNTGAVYGLATMLLRIEREQKPTHISVVFDAPGRSFRQDVYAAYKAHRPPMPPELAEQLELLPRTFDAFGISTLSVDGYEADDVIATLARVASAQSLEVVICSSDKDLMQLCNESISLLDTMRNKRLGPVEVEEKFGVPPALVGDVLALMGDSIDNVPGVPGIGPKTAAELVRKYGSLEGVLSHAREVKGKRGEALVAALDDVRIARKLVALHEDVPLPVPLDALARLPPNRDKLVALFRDLEFTRLMAQLETVLATHEERTASAAALATLDPEDAAEAVAGASDDSDAAGAPLEARAPTPHAEPVAPELLLTVADVTSFVARATAAAVTGVSFVVDGSDPMRAGLVGLGFALPDGTRAYLPLAQATLPTLDGPRTLRENEALPALATWLADANAAKHVHDGKTLEVLLGQRGYALSGVTGDAQLAAYLLDASRTKYDLATVVAAEGLTPIAGRVEWLGQGRAARAPADVAVGEVARHLAAEAAATLELVPRQSARIDAMALTSIYRDLELPLARVLARVEARGIRLDVGTLAELGQEVGGTIAALETEIHEIAGGPFNIGSPKQLQEVLFTRLGLPVVRRTKTGASTDADVLEELATQHPVPAKILEYRMLTKLKGTYIDAFPALVNPRTGRLHTTYHQTVAATGRLSSSDPNLQNIPIRSEVGRRIRAAFIADPGFRIVAADYSQIELRILAHYSEDPAFLDAFRSGQDIHQRTAAEVFGVPADTVNAEQRRIAKAINFGLVFGQTDFGLAQVLRIPRAQARAYIEAYFARYAGVRSYMERAIAQARLAGEVTTLLGRRRPLPEIRATRSQDRAYAERIARNSPIQGSAADLLKMAMIRVEDGLQRRWRGASASAPRLLLTVHDELVFEVPDADVAEVSAFVREEMESVFALRVPLVVDVGSGATWGQAH